MALNSRRQFIRNSVLGLATSVVATKALIQPAAAQYAVKAGDALTLSTAEPPWAPAKIIDTSAMQWEPGRAWDRKVLYWNPESGSHLMLLYVPPGWKGAPNHYHLFHEWAYSLEGDLTNNEYMSPDQKKGVLMQFREGDWLDRPAYSLHGGEPERLDSQVGSLLLIHEEGLTSIGVTGSSLGYPTQDAYKDVKEWSRPRIIDTIGDMRWEDHPGANGVKIEPLVDDPGRGFRANLLWLPPGWTTDKDPGFARAYHYERELEINFVLAGELTTQAYRTPDSKSETFTLDQYSYFERGPKCISGLAEQRPAGRLGCAWLQVTYSDASRGAVSDQPIGERIYV